MKRILITILLNSILGLTGFAQSGKIKGVITDNTDKTGLGGITVQLLFQKDSSIIKSTVTNARGLFEFSQLTADSFIVTASSVGYQQYVNFIRINENEKDLGSIGLIKQGKDLTGVTVVSKASPVIQKGDTSQFSASQYKVNPDANTEDLVKKMPGITVDKDGTVTAQGEQVRKVTVDGKDFFAKKYINNEIATQTIILFFAYIGLFIE